MGRIADLVNRLDPYHLTSYELHELAALLDSLAGRSAEAKWSIPISVSEGPGIDITGGNRIGVGHDSILLVDAGTTSAREYPANNAGFTDANSAAASGDVILIPTCTITGNHTIAADVSVVGYSRYASKFSGQITMGSGSTMENLTITRTDDSASTIKGIINPSSGTAYVHSCDVKADQSGSGDAYAISLDNNGGMEFWNCYLYGNSGSGSGYAGYDGGGSGTVSFFGGRLNGSTDEFG
jgi:hypothetical protein